MKKRLICIAIISACVFAFMACTKKEEYKGQKPIEDVNSLLDKYVEEEESSEEPKETESIDYDKIDQEVIDNIVANGGTVTSGEELANDPSTNASLATIGPIYYSTDGFTLLEEASNGAKTYSGKTNLDAVYIWAGSDYSTFASSQEIMTYLESLLIDMYGAYRQKSTYVNKNGIEFNWYRYDNINTNGVYVMHDMFYYTDGYDTIIIECVTNASLEATTDRIYKLVDSVRFK